MNFLPSRFRPTTMMSSSSGDPEKGPDTDPIDELPLESRVAIDGPGSKLEKFRYLVGIHNDASLIAANNRPAKNTGIYRRIVDAENRARSQHSVFAFLINGALGLQIIFAAAVTALGAGNGPHGAVTAFGAMNTILAGFLTFLKGSGLPNRLKYYENEWTKVREYIEQRERDFATDHSDLDLVQELLFVERMYGDVKRDIEANTPDSYVSISVARGLGKSDGTTVSRLK